MMTERMVITIKDTKDIPAVALALLKSGYTVAKKGERSEPRRRNAAKRHERRSLRPEGGQAAKRRAKVNGKLENMVVATRDSKEAAERDV